MSVRSGLAAACAISTLLGASHACAEDSVPLRLRYEAPAECPNAEAFFAEVVARTALAQRARANEPASALIVTIRSVPGGHAGRFELEARGAKSTREVSAAQCAQLVTALALITALAIDPNASTAPTVKTASPTPSPPPPAPPAARPRLRWKAGAAVELLAGFGSSPSLLVRPFVELAREGRGPFSYAFRLAAERAQNTAVKAAGDAELTLWAGRAEACPLRLAASTRVRVVSCVTLDLGQLQANASGVSPTRKVDRPWVAPGALGRLELQLHDMLALEVAGELASPLVRDRFFVNTNATLYRAPALVGGAALGLAFCFP